MSLKEIKLFANLFYLKCEGVFIERVLSPMPWIVLGLKSTVRFFHKKQVKSGAMDPEEHIIEGVRESADEFIIRLCKSVDRVGAAGAGSVASDFEGNIQTFLSADQERLQRIVNSQGRAVLNETQIAALIERKSVMPTGLSLQESWIYYLGREFLLSQVRMVRDLSFADFDINPLLAKALSLDSPKKVITFNVYQTVTRSVVTSWGAAVQEIAKFVGCKDNDYIIEGQTGSNFDLKKTVGGVDYYIQIKSGPNTMNVGMVTSLNNAIKHIETNRSGARGILGMTYGTRSRISAQIMSNLAGADTRMKIGRELWDFISEKEDFHKVLFRLLDASSANILENSFIELVEAKASELEEVWKNNHPNATLDDLLEGFI